MPEVGSLERNHIAMADPPRRPESRSRSPVVHLATDRPRDRAAANRQDAVTPP